MIRPKWLLVSPLSVRARVALLSLAAMVPLSADMPIGAWLARRVSKAAFDKIILLLLTVIAVKLMFDALI